MPVAQLDRVTGYEPVGQGFESLQARHLDELIYIINMKSPIYRAFLLSKR